jgi:anaphase-promoting complex subunit 4
VFLAVNGRVGRRVACILDEVGSTMEALDLEGEGEDIEGEEDADADAGDGEA